MPYLHIRDLHKSFAHQVVFEGLEMVIEQGQRVALVGANGAGKTTLIRTIMGEMDYHQGEVIWSDKIHVGWLRQESELDPEQKVIDILFADDTPRSIAIKQYEAILDAEDFDHEAYACIQRTIDQLDAWSYESRVRSIISQLQLKPYLQQPLGQLSGGEAKRIALAKILIQDPEMLILDEPTNHLDIEMIERLEDYIARYDLTVLMVTHDRYFLDRVCTDIYELYAGEIITYPGSYQHYIYRKSQRDEQADQDLHNLRQLYKKELTRMRTSPRARQTKSVERQGKFYDIESNYKDARSKSKLRAKTLELSAATSRIGGKIVKIQNISKSYNDKMLVKDFSYDFTKGERIGIIGPNGIGKSTLIRMITGQDEPDSGHIIVGKTVVFGHYEQHHRDLDESKKVIDIVKETAPYIRQADGSKLSAGKMLERFMFSPRKQHTFVRHLSGGERRRLTLLLVLLENPNFLILDEPTNDLDIDTIYVLEQFLQAYEGCLVIISHDRLFVDKIVDHLLIFEGEGVIQDFRGSYSEYKEQQAVVTPLSDISGEDEEVSDDTDHSTQDGSKTQAKLSYMDQREFDAIGPAVEALEAEKDAINLQFQDSSLDHETLKKLSKRMAELVEEIEQKEARWMELLEKIS